MPPKLRAPGTCEHIWSPWRRNDHPCFNPDVEIRNCELCWGFQLAVNEEDRAKWERAALEANLDGPWKPGP